MIYSNRCAFLSNSGLGGSCNFSGAQRRVSGPFRLMCMAPSNRGGDRNGSVVMEIETQSTTPLKEIRSDSAVADVDDNEISSGGPQDVYGEDRVIT